MPCYLTCGIAIGLIVANIYTTYSCKEQLYANKIKDTMTDNEKKIYEEIIQERFEINKRGLIYGLLAGAIFLYLYKNSSIVKNKIKKMVGETDKFYVGCLAGSIITMIHLFYYMLHPKKKWVLDNISNTETAKQWLQMYKYMVSRFHMGFLVGSIGYGLLCYSIVNNE